MSDPVRQTEFLVQRLAELGVEAKPSGARTSAYGELELGGETFETLDGGFAIELARFYTLGHNRLKFYAPRILFELAALDISSCRSPRQIEAALRRAWRKRHRELTTAHGWLQELGADVRTTTRGARLYLSLEEERGASAVVVSQSEIQLPSVGPLAHVSLEEPAQRRYRPLRNLDHSTELLLGIEQAIDRAGADGKVTDAPPPPPARPASAPESELTWTPRILALDHDVASLEALEQALGACGLTVEGFSDPARALSSFTERSYDLVLAEAHMPRSDGFEFTARLRDIAGIEKLPVVLVDSRENEATREAAGVAGASAYMVRPVSWSEAGETLVYLLDSLHVRRFVRYPLRLSVDVLEEQQARTDLTQSVGRGGMALRTRRDLSPGTIERYRVKLPPPLPVLEVDGVVISQRSEPGRATMIAGVRFVRYQGDGEVTWIRLIEALARRAERQRPTS